MASIRSVAPNYANERWPGSGGLRVPQEAGAATLEVYSEVDLGAVSGTINLTPQQASASLIVLTPTANMTLVLPGCQPGNGTTVINLGAFTVTVQISGNATNTAVIPASGNHTFMQTGYNNGVALVA